MVDSQRSGGSQRPSQAESDDHSSTSTLAARRNQTAFASCAFVLLQSELALDESGATRGVDEPAAPDFPAGRLFHEMHPVSRAVRAEIEAAHHRAIDELDAERTRVLAEKVLEDAAIQLVARRRQVATRAELRDLIDGGAALVEEEAEAELSELVTVEMLSQPEHGVEVVRADLDQRLADLVRGGRHRMRTALDHEDLHRCELLTQLDRERKAREAAAENDHVVIGGHAWRTWMFNDARSASVSCKVAGASQCSGGNPNPNRSAGATWSITRSY